MTATTRFNKFGATYAQVMSMYPGSILTDYDGGGAAGQAVIESVLDRIAREVAAAMSPDAYKQITEVDCQEVVRYATEGQTSFTLGLIPVISGTLHLWIYPPVATQEIRDYGINGTPYTMTSDYYYRKPVMGYGEVATADYSLVTSTGVITYNGPAISLGSRVYASYDTDITSVSYALPSAADLVLLGTAAELGSRIYSESTQEWKLVTQYAERYKAALELAGAGKWIPDELRALTYFTELEKDSEQVSSVRLYRG